MRTESYLIKPHEFRFMIEIYKPVPKSGVTDEGLPTSTYEDNYERVLTTRAKIINVSGKEFQLAEGITTLKTSRFIIRYPIHLNEEIDETYRIKYKNSFYNINYVKDIEERRIYLDIVAEKVI